MMRAGRARRWFGGLSAAVLVLSGCSVELVSVNPPDQPPADLQSPSASSTPTAAIGATTPAASAPSPASTYHKPDDPTEKDLAQRSYYADEIEVTTGCPGGKLTLDQSSRVTAITEDCHEVRVTAPFTTLLAEKIDTLIVEDTASLGHFIIREIGTARIDAPFNHVYWDRGKPQLKVSGFRCVVKPNPVPE
ncbi:MAG TPA: hypothetical protein DCM67_10615 [Propionibacteriaceae bacterium]|nr:hypothetical protein [Propionibacteriaceae bacterium]